MLCPGPCPSPSLSHPVPVPSPLQQAAAVSSLYCLVIHVVRLLVAKLLSQIIRVPYLQSRSSDLLPFRFSIQLPSAHVPTELAERADWQLPIKGVARNLSVTVNSSPLFSRGFCSVWKDFILTRLLSRTYGNSSLKSWKVSNGTIPHLKLTVKAVLVSPCDAGLSLLKPAVPTVWLQTAFWCNTSCWLKYNGPGFSGFASDSDQKAASLWRAGSFWPSWLDVWRAFPLNGPGGCFHSCDVAQQCVKHSKYSGCVILWTIRDSFIDNICMSGVTAGGWMLRTAGFLHSHWSIPLSLGTSHFAWLVEKKSAWVQNLVWKELVQC